MKSQKITAALVRTLILPRKKDSNKGSYGHVLVIAGSRNMPGAAVLCAHAALRSGAGLVTVAVCKGIRETVLRKLRPESMALPLSESNSGTLSPKAAKEILSFIAKRKVTVVALGPGIGQNSGISKLVKKILSMEGITVVLDADGLNAISKIDLKNASCKLIITPHPGEMARLTGRTIEDIQSNRKSAAKRVAAETGAVCVLKGTGTIVSDGSKVFVNTTGNPGMARGGSGDVLTGMLAAMLGQVKTPARLNAAISGVYLHGLAGDMAAGEKTEIGMLPGDISEVFPEALKKVIKNEQ
jgi:NAD(P)H-hydrate epimerase